MDTQRKNQDALGLLNGIPLNPVHRNRGIDAVLVEQSKRAILIQTHTNDLFDEFEVHEGIIVLQSPSVQIADMLK